MSAPPPYSPPPYNAPGAAPPAAQPYYAAPHGAPPAQPYYAAPQPYAAQPQPQPQPYVAQPYAAQQPYYSPKNTQENVPLVAASSSERFAPTQCRDAVWAVIFLVVLVGWLGLTFGTWNDNLLSKSRSTQSNADEGSSSSSDPTPAPSPRADASKVRTMGTITAYLCLIGMGVAAFWLQMIKRFPKQMIYTVLVCNVLFCFAIALLFFANGIIIGGLIWLVMGALSAFFYYMWRWRIPFAAEMLRTVSGVVQLFPATVIFAFCSLLAMVAWLFVWILGTSSIANLNANGAYVFALLVFYWVAQVIKNVTHVGTAGLFASWYFAYGTPAMQRNPTVQSYKRALTTSFGSVVLGSLIIAIIQTVRAVLRSIANNNNRSGVAAFLAACANCILGCIESLVEYFNRYAFTQVAVYGKTYIQAAKDTWSLFKTHGFDVIVNDDLTSPVLSFTAFLAGIMLALVAFAWGAAEFGLKDSNLGYVIVLTIIGFLVGFVECAVTLESVSSGVAAVMVCFAEAPAVLESRDPVLFQRFQSTYGPRIGFASSA